MPTQQTVQAGWEQPGADTNPSEDQEDPVERVEVAQRPAW